MRDKFIVTFHISLVVVMFLFLFSPSLNNHIFSNLTYSTLSVLHLSNIAKSSKQLTDIFIKIESKICGYNTKHAF